jgi:hypothetical protein
VKPKIGPDRVFIFLSCFAICLILLGYNTRIASAQVLYGSIVRDGYRPDCPTVHFTDKNSEGSKARRVNRARWTAPLKKDTLLIRVPMEVCPGP